MLRNIVFKVFHNLFTHFFRLESLCPSLLLRDSVMSPGLAIIPLTTRGHHLPSSWTQLPQLHTPVTYYTLSCCPLSQTLYFPLSHHSAWLIICCSCCYFGDTCTVLPFYVSHSLTRFVFLPCFFIKKYTYLHIDMDLVLSTVLPYRAETDTASLTHPFYS